MCLSWGILDISVFFSSMTLIKFKSLEIQSLIFGNILWFLLRVVNEYFLMALCCQVLQRARVVLFILGRLGLQAQGLSANDWNSD
jgi:hypothetical protein